MSKEQGQELTAEQIAASAPVSLPAGSFDVETLKEGLDKAAAGDLQNRDAAISQAVKAADNSAHEQVDPSLVPGNRFAEVERKDLGVTERIQVYDIPVDEQAKDPPAPPPPPPPPPPAEKGKGKDETTQTSGDAGSQE